MSALSFTGGVLAMLLACALLAVASWGCDELLGDDEDLDR